jgi:hypothetical protein
MIYAILSCSQDENRKIPFPAAIVSRDAGNHQESPRLEHIQITKD